MLKKILDNSFWSIIEKIGTGAAVFISLPLLIKVFGKESYGILVLARSLNFFMFFLMFGMPQGIIKYVAEWLACKNYEKIYSVVSTIFTCFLIGGLICCAVLSAIAFSGITLFKVDESYFVLLRQLILVSAIASIVTLPANLIDRLLIATEELAYTSKLNLIQRVLWVGLIIYIYNRPDAISLVQYLIIQNILQFILIPFKLIRWHKYASVQKTFHLNFNFRSLKEILNYSLIIFVLGVVTMLFWQTRPLVVGLRAAGSAASELTYFDIVNKIASYVLLISGTTVTALLPVASRMFSNNDSKNIRKLIVDGTRYTWGCFALVLFGIIMLSKEALLLYVGEDFIHLIIWLQLLLVAVSLNVYLGPIVSVIFASGNVLIILKWCIFSVAVSFSVGWFLTPRLGIGGVVIGSFCYTSLQSMFYHIYYLPKHFKVSFYCQFIKVFLPPVIFGVLMCLLVRPIIANVQDLWLRVASGILLGTAVYGILTLIFYVRPSEIKLLVHKYRKS